MRGDATSEDLRSTLERLSDRSVPGAERLALGSWRARAGLGATGRANSTWAPGPADRPLSDAIDEVEAWYRDRGLPPKFQVFDGTDGELVAELGARGWTVVEASLVMAADVDVVIGRAGRNGVVIRSTDHPTGAFEALMDDERRLRETTAAELRRHFVTVTDGNDRILGGGMTTLDGPWTAVQAMKTMPRARRRGVASAVIAALVGAAAESGAERAWLQVAASNAAAIALYEKLGFVSVHRYRYHAAPR